MLSDQLECGGTAPRSILAVGCAEASGLLYSVIESVMVNADLVRVVGGDLHLTERGTVAAQKINAALTTNVKGN